MTSSEYAVVVADRVWFECLMLECAERAQDGWALFSVSSANGDTQRRVWAKQVSIQSGREFVREYTFLRSR